MGLLKNKGKDEIELSKLKPGTPIEISQIGDISFSHSHKTKLEGFLSETEATLLSPMANGQLIRLSTTTKYAILFKTSDGIFKNIIEVISNTVVDGIGMAKVKIVGKTQRIQRRASYRLETCLDFEFDVVEDDTEQTLKEDDVLLSKARTIDISSGGIKFYSNEDIQEQDFIKILIKEDNLFVVAIGVILFKENTLLLNNNPNKYSFSYKCKFTNIPKRYKEDLSKYIFETQRELSKKGRIFNK